MLLYWPGDNYCHAYPVNTHSSCKSLMKLTRSAISTIRIAYVLGWSKVARFIPAFADEKMEHGLLKELLSRPEIDEFYEGVMLEAAHQR